MTLLEAIFLGILQGLTEFLPVSSSGHLVLAQKYLGLNEPMVFFDVMLHVGTLAAVLVVYRGAIARLVLGGFSTFGDKQFYRKPIVTVRSSQELRFIWLILLGSIPTGIIAVLFKTQLESLFNEVRLVSMMLILTGIILQLPRLRKQDTNSTRLCHYSRYIAFWLNNFAWIIFGNSSKNCRRIFLPSLSPRHSWCSST